MAFFIIGLSVSYLLNRRADTRMVQELVIKSQFVNNEAIINQLNQAIQSKDTNFFSAHGLSKNLGDVLKEVNYLDRLRKGRIQVEQEMSQAAYPSEMSPWLRYQEVIYIGLIYKDSNESAKAVEAVLNYLDNIPYRNKLREQAAEILNDKIAIYTTQLNQLDSLKAIAKVPAQDIWTETLLMLGLKEAQTQLKNLSSNLLVYQSPIFWQNGLKISIVLLGGLISAFLFLSASFLLKK